MAQLFNPVFFATPTPDVLLSHFRSSCSRPHSGMGSHSLPSCTPAFPASTRTLAALLVVKTNFNDWFACRCGCCGCMYLSLGSKKEVLVPQA